MKALGFRPKWIELIMTCVTIDSYSIFVNNKLGASFSPTRGLRQRDPLSSYLLLICTKGLSSMISQLERRGKIQGVSLGSRGSSRVGHLFFANDNILFYSATRDEWHKIKNKKSFNCTNKHPVRRWMSKNPSFFQFKYSAYTQRAITQAIGGRICGNYDHYLGLPPLVGQSKINSFHWIKEKVWQRINNWKKKL